MQTQEFDKLMKGEPAKWAEMFTQKIPKNQELNDNPEFKLTLIPGESKEEQREKIKANEVPIPDYIRDEIHKFIKEEREKKTSERAIRRAVKRKWNIYVV